MTDDPLPPPAVPIGSGQYPLCRCPPTECLLHPSLKTCGMRDGPAPSGSASVIVQPLRVPNGVVLTIPRYVVRYIASEGGEPALYDEAIGAYAQFDVGEYVIRAQDHDRLVADLHAALAKSEQARKDAEAMTNQWLTARVAFYANHTDRLQAELEGLKAARATAEQERDKWKALALGSSEAHMQTRETLAIACRERDARVSVEALRAINSRIQAAVQKYRSPNDAITRAIAGGNPIGMMPISQVWTLFCSLDALCNATGETLEHKRVCGQPAPDRSGRYCDKPSGHTGEHWTYGGNELLWSQGEPPADNELTRVTRQRDALQGEVERLKADQAGHDLIVTEALRTAQEQVEASKSSKLDTQ